MMEASNFLLNLLNYFFFSGWVQRYTFLSPFPRFEVRQSFKTFMLLLHRISECLTLGCESTLQISSMHCCSWTHCSSFHFDIHLACVLWNFAEHKQVICIVFILLLLDIFEGPRKNTICRMYASQHFSLCSMFNFVTLYSVHYNAMGQAEELSLRSKRRPHLNCQRL